MATYFLVAAIAVYLVLLVLHSKMTRDLRRRQDTIAGKLLDLEKTVSEVTSETRANIRQAIVATESARTATPTSLLARIPMEKTFYFDIPLVSKKAATFERVYIHEFFKQVFSFDEKLSHQIERAWGENVKTKRNLLYAQAQVGRKQWRKPASQKRRKAVDDIFGDVDPARRMPMTRSVN